MRSESRTAGVSRHGRWCRAAGAVFAKEMLETLRDRRTLLAAIVLPAVTMPLMVLAAPALLRWQEQSLQERSVRVAVEDEGARPFLDAVAKGTIMVLEPEDPRAALLRGEVDAVLAVDTASETPGLVVLYDETRPASSAAARALAGVAGTVLAPPGSGGGPPAGSSPGRSGRVELRNLATPERMGGALLASALPLFLAVWVLLGGQHAALDVGVGERERGTLEPLLALPADRSAVAAGKFLAVLAPSVAALAVTLVSGVTALALGGGLFAGSPVAVTLPARVAVQVVLVGIALAGLLSAAQLAVSLAARTLREAQQAFTGLYLVVALPAMLLPLAGEALDRPWMPLVPVLNGVFAIRGLLASKINTAHLGLTLLSLVVLTVPLVAWGGFLLGRTSAPNRR
jgi:sodium transport system permease protein